MSKRAYSWNRRPRPCSSLLSVNREPPRPGSFYSTPPARSLPTLGERNKKLFAALHVSVCRGSLSPQRSVVKRTPSWRWRYECPQETLRSACEIRGTFLSPFSLPHHYSHHSRSPPTYSSHHIS